MSLPERADREHVGIDPWLSLAWLSKSSVTLFAHPPRGQLPGCPYFVRVRTNRVEFLNVPCGLLGVTRSFTQESLPLEATGVQLGTAAALPAKAIKPTPKAAAHARTNAARL